MWLVDSERGVVMVLLMGNTWMFFKRGFLEVFWNVENGGVLSYETTCFLLF